MAWKRIDQEQGLPVEKAPKVNYSYPEQTLEAFLRGVSPVPMDREREAYQRAIKPTLDPQGRPVPAPGPVPSLNLNQAPYDPSAEAAAAQVKAEREAYQSENPVTAYGLEYGPSVVSAVKGIYGLGKAGARKLGKSLTGMTREIADVYAKDPKAAEKMAESFKNPIESNLSVSTRQKLARGQENISQNVIPGIKAQRDEMLQQIPDISRVEVDKLGPKAQAYVKAYYSRPATPKGTEQLRGPMGEIIEAAEQTPRVVDMSAKDMYDMKDAVGADGPTTSYIKGQMRGYGDVGTAIDNLDDEIYDYSRTRKTLNKARKSEAPEQVYARDTQSNIRAQRAAGLEEEAKQLQAGRALDVPFELMSPIKTGAPKLGAAILRQTGPSTPGQVTDPLRQLITGAGLAVTPESTKGYAVQKPPSKWKKVE